MRRIVFIFIGVIGLLTLASCGSTAPCGLSKTIKDVQQQDAAEILVAEAVTE